MLSRITQRQLEYFVASGEAGSIIGASERIHVSSPSISAAITHIESELGVQLFVHHHAQGVSRNWSSGIKRGEADSGTDVESVHRLRVAE
ncbi:hypothetical protein E05_05430 [Plautia stali symbiont]|nr:hypothetical protein E05_05430 [Plautia stali symbiont]